MEAGRERGGKARPLRAKNQLTSSGHTDLAESHVRQDVESYILFVHRYWQELFWTLFNTFREKQSVRRYQGRFEYIVMSHIPHVGATFYASE
jgi:hypothetical protein